MADAVTAVMAAAHARGAAGELARAVGHGAGDVTFAIDVPTEEAIDRWLEEHARRAPLSLLTEDRGWRHRGPDGTGRARALDGFDHGGPRIVIDPIDGTRNLMHGLRSAWSVVAVAAPGTGQPRLADVEIGIVSEIPLSALVPRRRLRARRGSGCGLQEVQPGGEILDRGVLRRAPCDDVTSGYFPFFRYGYAQRPLLARIEAAFFERLVRREGSDGRSFWDDQYISSGGQLALLALGHYRALFDLRAYLTARCGLASQPTKPYDCAGAILCAREAGAIVEGVRGEELDFLLDARTPVSFVGWSDSACARRLRPHFEAALRAALPP